MGLNKLLMSYNKCSPTKICWLLWNYRKADDSVKTEQPDRISLVLLNNWFKRIRTFSWRILSSKLLFEKCSTFVSWRSISVSQTRMFSLVASNSSLRLVKCWIGRRKPLLQEFIYWKRCHRSPLKRFCFKAAVHLNGLQDTNDSMSCIEMSSRDAGTKCPTLVNYSNWGGNKTSAVILIRKKILLPRCIMKIHSPILLYQCNSPLDSGLII